MSLRHRRRPSSYARRGGFVTKFFLTGLLLAKAANAWAGESKATVSFVGASETAGFGLATTDFAYPEILAQRCGFVAKVDGEANKPVLFRELPSSGTALVLFVSQFDAYLQPSRAEMETWLESAATLRKIIVEAPLIPLKRSNGLADDQRRFYSALNYVASETGATIVLLHYPQKVEDFTEADGLHPNERGQIYIADVLQPVLKAAQLCVHE